MAREISKRFEETVDRHARRARRALCRGAAQGRDRRSSSARPARPRRPARRRSTRRCARRWPASRPRAPRPRWPQRLGLPEARRLRARAAAQMNRQQSRARRAAGGAARRLVAAAQGLADPRRAGAHAGRRGRPGRPARPHRSPSSRSRRAPPRPRPDLALDEYRLRRVAARRRGARAALRARPATICASTPCSSFPGDGRAMSVTLRKDDNAKLKSEIARH